MTLYMYHTLDLMFNEHNQELLVCVNSSRIDVHKTAYTHVFTIKLVR